MRLFSDSGFIQRAWRRQEIEFKVEGKSGQDAGVDVAVCSFDRGTFKGHHKST